MHNSLGLFLFFLSALLRASHSVLDYSEMEALGISCPERDSCARFRQDRSYMDRNCECDSACRSYGDCCIDAFRRRSGSRITRRTDVVCLNYGEGNHTGVYVVNNCSRAWTGSREVAQKCTGPLDLSDPLKSAPVTSIAQSITYKNIYCAECNNVHMQSLKTFHIKLSCEGLEDISQAQIMGDLFYDRQRASWGVNRLDDQGNTNFVECDVIYDVPDYLNSSVRFCRSNVISTCASDWTRLRVAEKCDAYMAVVYDDVRAYRNPHCAICNYKTVSSIACRTSLTGRKRPMSFALLLDVNQSDGDQVGMTHVATPQCPSGHKYDPFFKRCRKLVCALPGHEVVNGRCVPGS